MTILDRYIGRSLLSSTLLVFIVLLGLFTFFEFVDKLSDLGRAGFGLYQITRYLVLTLPRKIYELFPMAALLGATLGLSSLAIGSELIAMRAGGVSLMRIVLSVMKIGIAFALAAVLIGEFIAPASENLAQRGRAEALQVGILQENFGVWLRDGTIFISIGEVLPDLSLLGINIYQFDDQNHLRIQTYADGGRYEDGTWRLHGVSQSQIAEDGIQTRYLQFDTWKSILDPNVLAVFTVSPEALSAWNLYRYIQHLKHNQQETGRYELAFWYKIIAPVTTAVMVILAIPFVFSQPRSAGVGFRLFIGIMLGLAFFVLNRGFGFYSLLHGFPPVIGVLLPTLLFFLLSLLLFRRVA